MKRFAIGACALTCVLAGIGAWTMGPGDDGDDEVVIKLGDAPEVVRTAVGKLTPADKITKMIKETDDGVTIYEVEFSKDGAECSAALSAQGEVMEMEKSVTEAGLPAAALQALRKQYPGATFKSPVAVQKFYFEVEVVVDGKAHEVNVDAAGDIEDEHAKGEDKEDEGKKGEKDDD